MVQMMVMRVAVMTIMMFTVSLVNNSSRSQAAILSNLIAMEGNAHVKFCSDPRSAGHGIVNEANER